MRRLVSLVTIILMVATATTNGLFVSAQQSKLDQDPFAVPRAGMKPLPDNVALIVKRAKSPEAKAAWEKLPPELRDLVKTEVDKIIRQEEAKVAQQKRAQKAEQKTLKDAIKGKHESTDLDTSLSFSDNRGNRRLFKAKEREAHLVSVTQAAAQTTQPRLNNGQILRPAALKPNEQWASAFSYASRSPFITKASFVKASAPAVAQGGFDDDFDGLPDNFESALADAFTPIYHVSAHESNNYATFHDYVPQNPLQLFGPNPVSHFRVQPLGLTYTNSNQLVSVIRIDYLTLWDRDGGIVTDGLCSIFPGLRVFGLPHPIDNERSAALVAAPVSSFSYNLDPWAYSAYDYYTAAHEGRDNDKSAYHMPFQPVPAGWHLHLAQSWSKHATYTFNPDYLSLIPDYVLFSILVAADWACYRAAFDSWTDWRNYLCLAVVYYAYGAIFECGVERFIDQGGRFADLRINVGEPNNPINSSGFIRDNGHELYSKLVYPVWGINPAQPPSGSDLTVNISAWNGMFVVAEGNGGGDINANRSGAGPWETFTLSDLNGGELRDGDTVAIRAGSGHYFQALGGGGGALRAEGPAPNSWEQFTIINLDGAGGQIVNGTTIALRSENGHFVVAEGGGGEVVNVNRTGIGPWETFRLHIP